jgi:hypothetical protein
MTAAAMALVVARRWVVVAEEEDRKISKQQGDDFLPSGFAGPRFERAPLYCHGPERTDGRKVCEGRFVKEGRKEGRNDCE